MFKIRHRSWSIAVIILLSLALRLFVVTNIQWSNASDLNNYFWPAQKVLEHENPYQLWAQHLSGPRSDVTPLELAIFAFVISLRQSPGSIRLFFILCDLVCLGLLALLYRYDRRQQLLWLTMYGLGPAPLYMFTLTPSDKSLLFALMVAVFIQVSSVRTRWRWGVGVTIGLLAALKWIGLVIALPAIWAAGQRNRRALIWLSACTVVIFIVSHSLWYPSWQVVYEFRSSRLTAPPFHTGIAVILQSMGLPMPSLYWPLIVVSYAIIITAWGLKRLGWRQTGALLVWASVYWMPDTTPQMIWFVSMVLLLSVRWTSRPRVIIVWAGMLFETWVFAGAVYPVIGGPVNLDWASSLVGTYGSLQTAMLSQIFVWVCLAWVVIDSAAAAKQGRRPAPVSGVLGIEA